MYILSHQGEYVPTSYQLSLGGIAHPIFPLPFLKKIFCGFSDLLLKEKNFSFSLKRFVLPSTFFFKLSALAETCHGLSMLRFSISFTVAGSSASFPQVFAVSGWV